MLGEAEASGDISLDDVPNPPSISFGSDADVTDDYFKNCSYDGDSAVLTCPDFSTQCETSISMGSQDCYGVVTMTKFVPKVRCEWGLSNMGSGSG